MRTLGPMIPLSKVQESLLQDKDVDQFHTNMPANCFMEQSLSSFLLRLLLSNWFMQASFPHPQQEEISRACLPRSLPPSTDNRADIPAVQDRTGWMLQPIPGQRLWEKIDSGWKEQKGFTKETASELDPEGRFEFWWAKTFSLALLRKARLTWLGKNSFWVPVKCVPGLYCCFGYFSKRTAVLCDLRQPPYLSGPPLGL